MRKRMLSLALALVLCLCSGALAEDAAGLEAYTAVTFEWGGCPLLADDAERALGALLENTELRLVRHADGANGYAGLDVLMQGVSVMDLYMQAQNGVYYERSGLLNNQTVAFTAGEFAAFAAKIAETSGGMLPGSWGSVFAAVLSALSGQTPVAVAFDEKNRCLFALENWRADALEVVMTPGADIALPGLAGVSTETVDVSRDEALALVTSLGPLLAENSALWDAAAAAQMPGAQPEVVRQTAQRAAELAAAIPDALAQILPEDMPPAEYRSVYDADGTLVCTQISLEVPGETLLSAYLEWSPGDSSAAALYGALTVGQTQAEWQFTQDSALGRQISRLTLRDGEEALELLLTRETARKENRNGSTETTTTLLTAQSDALFGEGAQTALEIVTTATERGTGEAFVRRSETTVSLKGFGFDNRSVLTVKARTQRRALTVALHTAEDVLYPAQMETDALDAWLKDLNLRMTQAGFALISRLPKDTAAYLLKFMQQP